MGAVKFLKLAEACRRREAPPELDVVRREIDELADHEVPVTENTWRGIFVDEQFTRYAVWYYALEHDARGRVHKRQHQKTFRRDAPHFDPDGEPMTALDAAKRFKLDREVEIEQQREEAKDATLNDVFRTFTATNHHRDSTRSVYAYVYAKHIGPTLGRWLIRNLDIHSVERWYADLDIGPEAKAKAGRLLRALTNFAYRRGMIPSDPARVLTIRSSATTRPLSPDEIPTVEDVRRLVAEVPDRDRALILTMAIGGLRIGEAIALRVSRIDFRRGRITVDQAATEVSGKIVFGPPKTKAGDRTFTAPVALLDALERHISEYSPSGPHDRLVFTTDTGTPIRPGNWRRRVFDPAARRASLKVTPHTLRHHAGSLLAAGGASATEIAARLGHSNSAVTHRVYLHMLRSRDQALAAAQDELWNGGTAAR